MAALENKKQNRELCRVTTPTFRVSYPHVFKPQSMKPGDKAKYSVTMLFPKDSDLSGLKEAMKQAKIAKFGGKENWPDDLESCVSDGDSKKNADKDGYKGHWVVKATSNEDQKPAVRDADAGPIMDQADFYAGCYARAKVLAYAWEFMGKQGIGFILDGVQKVKDGKQFGGKVPADQMFTPIGTGESDDNEEMDFK